MSSGGITSTTLTVSRLIVGNSQINSTELICRVNSAGRSPPRMEERAGGDAQRLFGVGSGYARGEEGNIRREAQETASRPGRI